MPPCASLGSTGNILYYTLGNKVLYSASFPCQGGPQQTKTIGQLLGQSNPDTVSFVCFCETVLTNGPLIPALKTSLFFLAFRGSTFWEGRVMDKLHGGSRW